MSLSQLATRLYELREKKAELNSSISEINTELADIENKLLEEMVQEGMNRLDLQDKGSFYIATQKFFRINNREELLDFLHDQGDEDLLTVNHKTLNAYAKEILARKEAEGIEEFDIPGLEYTTKTQIRVSKSRK